MPKMYGHVPRYEQVLLTGKDKHGKPVKIKALGLLAHVFQHETDHLQGIVFVDKAKDLHQNAEDARLKQREAPKKSGQ